jgi:hypothetical protein
LFQKQFSHDISPTGMGHACTSFSPHRLVEHYVEDRGPINPGPEPSRFSWRLTSSDCLYHGPAWLDPMGCICAGKGIGQRGSR